MTGSGESSLRNVTVTGATVGMRVSNTSVEVSVSGVIIEQATGVGFLGFGASVAAAEVVIRDTQALSNGTFGRGLNIDGATVSFTRGLVSGNRDLGVFVGSESIATFENVVIEDTKEKVSDGSRGWGHAGQRRCAAQLRAWSCIGQSGCGGDCWKRWHHRHL